MTAEVEELRREIERLHARFVALAKVLPLDALGLLRMSDEDLARLARQPDPLDGWDDGGLFVFLARFEWDEQEAPGLLLRVFNETFGALEPVILVCSVTNRDEHVSVSREVEALGLRRWGGRIAFLRNRPLSDPELAVLFRSADCFVSAGRVGQADLLLKAMACGLPAIATDWGANWELVSEETCYPLRIRGTVPATGSCPHAETVSWADPNPVHLATLLRHIFENQDEAREKGRRAAAKKDPGPVTRPERPRVAIDVSRGVGVEVSGIGRYALNLVRGLAVHGPEDLEFLLLPGLGTFVHPEYGRAFTLRTPAGRNMSVYDGPLPAFSGAGTAPRADLLHSTAYMAPEAGVPLLVTVHDLSFLTHPEHHTPENVDFCTRNIERAVAQGATFLAVSESTRNDLVARCSVDPARVHVVPNTYDDRQFGPRSERQKRLVRERYGLPERFFLFIASLEPRKNLATALEALERVDVGLPLVVAGASGWRNTPLSETLRRAGDRAPRIGYVEQEDLGALYSAATVLVYPSLYEGFGLPVLEAMACGTPVVTSNVSSLPEVAGDAAVLLDDPLDAEALGWAMQRLSQDAGERERLASRGLERAKRFSLEKATGELVALYRAELGRAAVRSA